MAESRKLKISPPTRARTNVVLFDLEDPQDYIISHYNPASFDAAIGAAIGAPQPVGWTGPVLQYGSTGSLQPIDLVLLFDERLGLEDRKEGGTMSGHWGYGNVLRWLTSRLHPRALGVAPSLVVVDWPNTVSMVAAIGSVKVNVHRWDAYLKVRAATITTSLHELVQGFRPSSDVAKGFGLEFARDSGGYTWGKQQGVGLGVSGG